MKVFDEIDARYAILSRHRIDSVLADYRNIFLSGRTFGLEADNFCWAGDYDNDFWACQREQASDLGLCESHYREIVGR